MKYKKWLGRTFYILLFLMIFASCRLAWLYYFSPATQQQAKNGELTIAKHLIDDDQLIYLRGEWHIYPNIKKDQIQHLSNLNNRLVTTLTNTQLHSTTAVSEMTLHLEKPLTTRQLIIKIPKSPYNTHIYIDGQVIPHSANKSGGQYDEYSIRFTPQKNDIQIRLYVQGTKDLSFPFFQKAVVLGTTEAIQSFENQYLLLFIIIGTTLILNSLYSLLVYFFVYRNKSVFLFTLAFLFPILDELYRIDRRLIEWLHITKTGEMKISAIFFALSAFFFVIVMNNLIPNKNPKHYKFILRSYIVGILGILVMPTPYFSYYNMALYILYVVSFIYIFLNIRKATRISETEMKFLLFTICAAVSGIIWDYIKSQLYFEIPFYPFDYICIELGFVGFWIYRYHLNQKKVESLISQLQLSNEMKEEFLENSAQKLFAPLSKLMVLADNIKKTSENQLTVSSKKQLEDLLKVGQGMYFSLKEVIDYTKLKDNILSYEVKPVNLNGAIYYVADLLQYHSQKSKIYLHIDSKFPYVMANESGLIQILYNLLYYALKNNKDQLIEVNAEILNQEALLKIVNVSVNQDDETIFNHDGESMNLSLYICEKLAELQGGRLQIESQNQQSINLVLTFPIVEDKNFPPMNYPPKEMEQNVKSQASFFILIVTESIEVIQLISAVFSTEEFELHFVNSSDEVLDSLKEHDWNLVIVDSILTSESGYHVIEKIRIKWSKVDLPILLVTTRQDSYEAGSYFKAGANDYMLKPLQPIELKNRSQALMDMQVNVEQKLLLESALLQAQIRPHFLYNTLNSIASLSRIDLEKMVELLNEFGNYLQSSFNSRNTQRLIPLAEELKLVKSYTYIEEQRFASRLKVEWQIDRDVNVMIPPFSLQTLVENAIRHGIQKKIEGGIVKIIIKHEENDVVIRVVDTGVGISPEKLSTIFEDTGERGIGIINTNHRLKRSYGEGLTIQSELGSGTSVTMRIPKKKAHEVAH